VRQSVLITVSKNVYTGVPAEHFENQSAQKLSSETRVVAKYEKHYQVHEEAR
jgi:hypothetical protein